MINMEDIQQAAKQIADARQILTQRKHEYELNINIVKKKYYQSIRSIGQKLAEKIQELKTLIKEGKPLFKSPRTQTFFGIRVGLKKEKGKMQIDNEEATIAAIKKHYPSTWKLYIRTEEKPHKKALESLPAAELKKLGIRITDDTDEVYIKFQDDEIDKFVEAILKDKDVEEAA